MARPVRSLRAAKTIAKAMGFNVTNLVLQKLLYIAHMHFLGTQGRPLIDGHFEAWNLGPVEPDIYHLLKAYGNKPIQDVFPYDSFDENSKEYEVIKMTVDALKDKRPSQLVAITHQNHGAWAKNFCADIRGIRIPEQDIREEFRNRVARAKNKAAQPRA